MLKRMMTYGFALAIALCPLAGCGGPGDVQVDVDRPDAELEFGGQTEDDDSTPEGAPDGAAPVD